MKIFIIILVVGFIWLAYEFYTAPLMNDGDQR